MLTEKAIAAAKPKEKVYRLADKTGNGLYLQVTPSGGKRWRFRYRHDGKEKMISLGVYPDVSLRETSPAWSFSHCLYEDSAVELQMEHPPLARTVRLFS
jgi:hypothetical protein